MDPFLTPPEVLVKSYLNSYQPLSVLPTGGVPRGSPEDALDTACGGCLGDPTAWIRPPKN